MDFDLIVLSTVQSIVVVALAATAPAYYESSWMSQMWGGVPT